MRAFGFSATERTDWYIMAEAERISVAQVFIRDSNPDLTTSNPDKM
jgi:hypothetical protein